MGLEIIDALVVCHAVSGGVDDRNIARAIGAHQAGHADQALGQEGQRIEILVAQPPVDHAHAL